jgi:hypothetical protein
VYIGERNGSTFVPPGSNFVVFESGINLGNSTPVYVTFKFTETPEWIQVSSDKVHRLQLSISNIKLQDEDTSPVLGATITNNSYFVIPDIGVAAILYDASGNAISASRTYVSLLHGEESQDLTFTWPEPFTGKVVTKEILPIFNIFNVRLK